MLRDSLEGWAGVEGRREAQDGGGHTDMYINGPFTLLYGRNQYSIAKQLSSN